MENRTKKTTGKRFLAFIFDTLFILLLSFTFYMLGGLIFKIDSEVYQSVMSIILLIVVFSYFFLGEFIYENTLGKYLAGIEIVSDQNSDKPSFQSFIKRALLKIIFPVEGFILLFSKQQKRLGDIWAKTVVVNKEINKLKSYLRLVIGLASIVALMFCFSVIMGLAVKHTDYYTIGIDYLKTNNKVEVVGLPKEVNESRCKVNFIVPVSNENNDKYAVVALKKSDGKWIAYYTEFFKDHSGLSYSFDLVCK
jgi:uncharacterized RDD family membrane protein YckC